MVAIVKKENFVYAICMISPNFRSNSRISDIVWWQDPSINFSWDEMFRGFMEKGLIPRLDTYLPGRTYPGLKIDGNLTMHGFSRSIVFPWSPMKQEFSTLWNARLAKDKQDEHLNKEIL